MVDSPRNSRAAFKMLSLGDSFTNTSSPCVFLLKIQIPERETNWPLLGHVPTLALTQVGGSCDRIPHQKSDKMRQEQSPRMLLPTEGGELPK